MTKISDSYLAALAPTPVDPLLNAADPIKAIASSLFTNLSAATAEPAKVIGLYGEWGCGKTYWLESIRYQVLKRHNEQASGQTNESLSETEQAVTIVPVFFNAWRFEKEEHLIVPLLKTTAYTLEEWAKAHESCYRKRLLKAGKHIALSAAAIAYAFAKRVDKDLFKTQIIQTLENAQDAKDELDDRYTAEQTQWIAASSELESTYFKFHEHMRGIIKGSPAIRLLFLIDDLDRCLPEKAVEMLESIKLFLELDGTAFVVAVDDEVVERGIAHRYKDYGKSFDERQRHSPVTGHEYLEKIIHLPVRIDRPQMLQVGDFISKRCPALQQLLTDAELADAEQAGTELAATEQASAKASAEGSSAQESPNQVSDQHLAELAKAERQPAAATTASTQLKAVLKLIPAVPRKLLRLSELLGYKQVVFKLQSLDDRLALLRLIALQLFCPDIYRIAQRNEGAHNIFSRMQDLATTLYSDAWPNYELIQQQHNKHQPKDETSVSRRRENETVTKPLIQALVNSRHQRSGFDPAAFIDCDDWEPSRIKNWARFYGNPRPASSATPAQAPAAQAGSQQPTGSAAGSKTPGEKTQDDGQLPELYPSIELDSDALSSFIDALMSDYPSRWQEALDTLNGQRLVAKQASALLDELKRNKQGLDKVKQEWLQSCAAALPPQAIFQAAETLQLAKPAKTLQAWREQLAENMVDMQQHPNAEADNMDDLQQHAAERRLWHGDLLAYLGDHRPGAGVSSRQAALQAALQALSGLNND